MSAFFSRREPAPIGRCGSFLPIGLGLSAALITAVVFSPTPARAATTCANLAALAQTGSTIITTAQENAATSSAPAHCEVIGKINSRVGALGLNLGIGFHLRMPDAWNGRFYFQGGGGLEGSLGSATGAPLNQGYALVTTDAGHDNTLDNNPNAGGTAAFGADPQARLDFGYNSLDKVAVVSKTIIALYYGEKPTYSYFVGCSDGGRQAMMLSQRFPSYFDGIIAGDPGWQEPKAAIAGSWNAQTLEPLATRLDTQGLPYLPDTLTTADLALVGNAVLKACDGLDGLVDGIVDNYPACTNKKVYPQLDALKCSGAKTASCLSADQLGALKKIFAGPRNSKGKPLYATWPWDPGVGINTANSLQAWSIGTQAAPGKPLVNNATKVALGGGALSMLWVAPPNILPTTALEQNFFSFNFDTDAPKIFQSSGIYTQSAVEFAEPNSTDLRPFERHGGKLIIYQGLADGAFSANDIKQWYDEMDEDMHGQSDRFSRLYMVPGMGHCGGGPATSQFDVFTPLVNWVENGIAPTSIVGTAPATGTPWPNRTRPLCPFPQETRYIGSGSIESVENFKCVSVMHRKDDGKRDFDHRDFDDHRDGDRDDDGDRGR
jgi:hypothetical protein